MCKCTGLLMTICAWLKDLDCARVAEEGRDQYCSIAHLHNTAGLCADSEDREDATNKVDIRRHVMYVAAEEPHECCTSRGIQTEGSRASEPRSPQCNAAAAVLRLPRGLHTYQIKHSANESKPARSCVTFLFVRR